MWKKDGGKIHQGKSVAESTEKRSLMATGEDRALMRRPVRYVQSHQEERQYGWVGTVKHQLVDFTNPKIQRLRFKICKFKK